MRMRLANIINRMFRRHPDTLVHQAGHALTPHTSWAVSQSLKFIAEHHDGTGGVELSMYCPECRNGSPRMPIYQAASMAVATGYVVLATCGRCRSPLTSRVLSQHTIDHILQLGVVDYDAAVGDLRADIRDL